ncbi:MAG: 3'-5' exoribonuclease YhaM family protein [Thermotogota bacterium]
MNNEEISLGEMLNNSNNNNDFIYEKINLINELEPGQNVEIQGKLISKRTQNTKDGKSFLLITIADKTGSLRGIDWFNPEKNEKLVIGDIISVKGKIVVFENRLQINIDKKENSIKKVAYEEIQTDKYISQSNKSINNLMEKLKSLIEQIEDIKLKEILKNILLNSLVSKQYQKAPAAMSIHHAYKHGLLDHSLNVTELSLKISENYNDYKVNKDILIAGSLLHDIGKIKEYKTTKAGIDKTEVGEMIGHMNLGISILESFFENISEEIKNHIYHIILSHHGELEYGSPILPKTMESMIVHFADNIDSKLIQVNQTITESLNENSESKWTNFEKRLGRKFKIQ